MKLFSGKKISVLFICNLVLILCIISCATGPPESSRPSLSQADLTNRLTAKGKTLRLPADWVFIPNSLDQGSVYNFRGPNHISGGLECLEFPYNISYEKLIDFYEDHVFHSDKKILTETMDHERLGQVVFFSGRSQSGDSMLSLLMAEENKVTFLYFSSPLTAPFSKDDALLILESFTEEERPWIQLRSRRDFPLFSSFDNSWYWYGDFRDGYYLGLTGAGSMEDILAGLWKVADGDIQDIENTDDLDIPPFVYRMNISNVPVEMTVYGAAGSGSIMKLYCIFEWEAEQYCFYLSQNADLNEASPETLLGKPEIQKLFDFHLLFSEVDL